MGEYQYLCDIAVILLSTKLLGLATRKFQMPQVVGALLAGLILGPAMFGLVQETDFVKKTAEIGVIVLMFCAGMETDLKEMKKSGKASFIIALIGVIVPLIGGYAIAAAFNRPGMIESDARGSLFLQNMFIGVILTATSVSITVETLKELGKLKTRSGNAILGAAIIDDVLGIVALTVITSMADTSVHLGVILLKIAGFFAFSLVAGVAFHKFYVTWIMHAERGLHRHVLIAFVFCLLMSYIAETFFGVADITGAFIAGVVISSTQRTKFLASKFDVLSYAYLSPIFFASIGLKVSLPKMDAAVLLFSAALVIVAILTKVAGCGIGGKVCGYTNKECVRIGVGMISRGEVALIVASKGEALGLMGSAFLGPVVLVVIITTIVTPVLLKVAYRGGVSHAIPAGEGFSNVYEEMGNYRSGAYMFKEHEEKQGGGNG